MQQSSIEDIFKKQVEKNLVKNEQKTELGNQQHKEPRMANAGDFNKFKEWAK